MKADPIERLTIGALVLVAAAFCIWAACVSRAHAGEVTFAYDNYAWGAPQVTGVPIGKSVFSMEFTAPVGKFDAGAEVEAVQTGKAGLSSDRITAHVGHPFTLGRLTLEPSLLAGYARGLNDVYGLAGASFSARYAIAPWLTLQARVRGWHSFAENLAPLNSAQLPHDPRHLIQIHAGPEFTFGKVAVGVQGGEDFGSLPGPHVGTYLRLGF